VAAIAASEARFVRIMPGSLPEPTILFSHRGARDPKTEGWRLCGKDLEDMGRPDFQMKAVHDHGEPSLLLRNPTDKWCYCQIGAGEGLTPEVIAEAKQKGWVLRARIWVGDKNRSPKGDLLGLCRFSYRDDEQACVLHPSIADDGSQTLVLCRNSSLGEDAVVTIPGSRNRFVDYEIRYNPATKVADVYANGRRIAEMLSNPNDTKAKPGLCFGMWKLGAETRFARLEWGILRGEDGVPSRGNDHKHGEP
jgi:hypothetical protein